MSTPMDKDLPRRPTNFEMDIWDETGWDESWEEIEPVPPPVRARANAFDDIFDGYGEDPLDGWNGTVDEDYYFMTFDRHVAKRRRLSKRARLWDPDVFERRVRQLAKSWNCSKQEARDRFWGELTPRKRRPRREFPRIIKRRRQYE